MDFYRLLLNVEGFSVGSIKNERTSVDFHKNKNFY